MIVTSRCVGHHVTGLNVGATNVHRYFPRNLTEIELELDHLRIQCGLTPEFWQDQPEIHDPRLCLWLESKQRSEQADHHAPLAMIRSGKSTFIVGHIEKVGQKEAFEAEEHSRENPHDGV